MDTFTVIVTAVYLLLGFQLAGRMFYWEVSREKAYGQYKIGWDIFAVTLCCVPIVWPIVLLLSLNSKVLLHEVIWGWGH